MLVINNVKNNIYTITIASPRQAQDEIDFMNFLNEIVDMDSFGLVLSVEGEKSFSQSGKRELGIWFKTNKKILGYKCIGFARVSEDASKVDTLKSRAMRLAMPCPYIVLPNVRQAVAWLESKS